MTGTTAAVVTMGGRAALAALLLLPSSAARATPDAGAESTAGEIPAAPTPRAAGINPPSSSPGFSPGSAPGSSAARAAARTLQSQALVRLRAGFTDEAARLLARAAEKDPDNAGILTDLGFTLGKLGRRDQAEATLRAAIARDPRRFYAYVNLADLLADDPGRWERRDQIVAFLEKGVEVLKDDARGRLLVLLRLANFERVVGRTAAARARLQPLLALEPAGGAPAARAQRKRVLDLLEAITLDERAQALEDWPAPDPSHEQLADADAAEAALDAGHADETRDRLDTLVLRAPSWSRARSARARAFEALGRVDEAVRDLEIVVNLSPSDAAAWRALGRLLATQGGALEADRADEALRNALILEPSWTELRTLRAQLARRRAALAPTLTTPRAAAPTERARTLYQEAEEWIESGDPAGLGRDRVEEALAESPGYVEAAVTFYALTGRVAATTVAALWDDGPALWALASGVRRLGLSAAPIRGAGQEPGAGGAADSDPAKDGLGGARAAVPLWSPWIDRAVTLDVQEARFARALTRAGAGDKPGALSDLVAYVAREPRPARLAEARALRTGLAGGEGRPAPELLARIRLLEDRPDAALAALGGACTADQPGDRLRAMGLVHEYGDQRQLARRCYELATAAGDEPAMLRLARLDARLADAELRGADRAALERASSKGIAAAHWALSRLAAAAGDESAALVSADLALALAASHTTVNSDPWVAAARAARDGLAATRRAAERAERDRRRRLGAAATGLAGLLLALVLRRRFHGRTVAAALRRRPALFPEVARAVAEIRHDVLKHRAGVLGLIAHSAAPRADIRRALTEPQPTSAVVGTIYDRLMHAARGIGLTLRPLAREPIFGALAHDLARAEALLGRAAGSVLRRTTPSPRTEAPHDPPHDPTTAITSVVDAALLAIDARLRGTHADRLAALLQLGPRTRLDATAVGAWIGAVEAATRRAGAGWAAPAMMLGDLAVEFPVEHGALHAIFANLLRNAQAAVAGREDARVIIRIDRERDVTGRQVAQLLVGDSAAATLTLETIEARESGRGLAIVRDLVRQWRGHMVVRPDATPFVKQVGACFPL